jgi:hypothetical protein
VNPATRATLLLVFTAWVALVLTGSLTIGWRIRPEWFLPGNFDIARLAEPLHAIGGFLLLLPAIIGWGCIAGRALRLLPVDSRPARALYILLLGQLTASLLVLFIGLVGLYPLGVWLVLFGAGGIASEAPIWLATIRGIRTPRTATGWWTLACVIVCIVAFIPALAPVVESDGLRYHLFAPQEWLKAGRITHLPYHAFSNLPLQHNMLYLAGLVIGNPTTTHLIHWLSLPTLILAAYCLTQQLLISTPNSSSHSHVLNTEFCILTSLLLVTLPVVLILSGWPFIDLATLAYILGAIHAATLANARTRSILAGLFCGAAIATKLTALIPAFLLGITFLFHRQHFRTFIIHNSSFIILLLLVPSPWLIKSALIHGNPVYPAAYNTFGGDEWSTETNDFYNERAAQRGFGRSLTDIISSPFDVTFRWSRFPGDVPSGFIRQEARERGFPNRLLMRNSPGFEEQNPGPAPLALLPLALISIIIALVFTIRRGGRAPSTARSPIIFILALQLLGGWIAWIFTYQSTRFLLVPLAIAIILAIPTLARLVHGHLTLWIARITLAACALTGFGWFVIYIHFVNPTAFVALGFINRDACIEHRFNAWPAVQFLNEHAGNDGVFYIGEHRGFHASYPVHLSDWFDKPLILTHIQSTTDNASILEQWHAQGIRYVLLNQAELSEYEDGLFRPRFTPAEWHRFAALRQHLLSTPTAIIYQHPTKPIQVIDLTQLPPPFLNPDSSFPPSSFILPNSAFHLPLGTPLALPLSM